MKYIQHHQSNASTEKTAENVCEAEELNFQFDDYGGKKYNFSDPPHLAG